MPQTSALLAQLFDRLDQWRHLPAYQLERRADTGEKQKYAGLIDAFVQLGFWTVPPDLKDYLHPPRVGLGTRLKDIALTAVQPSVEVVYIQPRPDAPRPAQGDGTRVIDFERFAQHVAAHPDPLSQRFAQSLRTWREPAGARAVLPPEPQR